MSVLPNHSVYSTNTQIDPDGDQFSGAIRKPQVTLETNGGPERANGFQFEPRATIHSGGFWLELLGALHASRRQAATRELNRYQHLVRDAQVLQRRSTLNVPPSTLPVKASRSPRVSVPLLVLACFMMIHAIAIVRVDSHSHLHSSPLSSPVDVGD
jgi:hypothetical protein